MDIKHILGEHPANHKIEKFKCGSHSCDNPAVGVFEIRDGTAIADAPLCSACAKKYAIAQL